MLVSAYAEACRCEALDGNVGFGKSGSGAHPGPILRNEGASDGDRAVVLDKWMQVGHFGKGLEESIRYRSAREVVDEPAHLSSVLHPGKKIDDLVFREVMSEE